MDETADEQRRTAEETAEDEATGTEARPEPSPSTLFKTGNPYRFQPGVSGNPSGRPKERVTKRIREMMDEDPRLVQAMANAAVKHFLAGKPSVYRDVMERLEGRIPYTVQTGEQEPESQYEFRVVVVSGPSVPQLTEKVVDVKPVEDRIPD
jgi:hypothetical protein